MLVVDKIIVLLLALLFPYLYRYVASSKAETYVSVSQDRVAYLKDLNLERHYFQIMIANSPETLLEPIQDLEAKTAFVRRVAGPDKALMNKVVRKVPGFFGRHHTLQDFEAKVGALSYECLLESPNLDAVDAFLSSAGAVLQCIRST